MKIRLLHITLLFMVCGPLLAQGEIDPQDRIFWRNERSMGLSLNSDGWSVIVRELRQTKPLHRYFFEGNITTFKHPKEIKISNFNFMNSGSFVFGKLNSVWAIGGGAGIQQELFEKKDLGGVSISWFAGGGVSLLFAKPIYYEILVKAGNDYYVLEEQKFDITSHQTLDIYGKASFFKGFNEITLYPGLYTRAGFNFEYSKNDKVTHSLELGAALNVFNKVIPIMASDDNKQFFPSLFVSYRIGLVLDPLNPEGFFEMFSKRRKE